jgi:glycosyltransferase involved in cell wall biosynthesis
VPRPLLSVILPAHNDIEHLVPFLPRLAQAVEIAENTCGPLEVIIVDDGSRDSTAACAAEHLKLFSSGRLVRLPWKCGLGTAVRAGICEATGESIVVLSCDEAVDGPYLLGLAELLETADAVLSSAAQAGPGSHGGRVQRLVDTSYSWLACRVTPTAIRRAHPVFVAFRTDVAKHLFLCRRPTGLAFDLETRVVSEAMNLRLAHLAPASDRTLAPALTREAGSEDGRLGARHLLRDLLRAYRHRSRIVEGGRLTPVRLAEPARADTESGPQKVYVPPMAIAAEGSPMPEIDLTGDEESILIGLAAPGEQQGAGM